MNSNLSTSSGSASPVMVNQPIGNPIELVSIKDSKITRVSVYPGLAELTRLFKLSVKSGQNQLDIAGLPRALVEDSLRVEGRSAATVLIHDVALTMLTPPSNSNTSPKLESLLPNQKKTEKALARALKSLSSLETYISSLKAENLETSKLGEAVSQYDAAAGALDEKIAELEKVLEDETEAIREERKQLAGLKRSDKLNMKASIVLSADREGDIEIALTYAVHHATWNAGYDIRVNMNRKEKPVNLIYKATITQNTGEDWDDVPLSLETATPTFGVGVPTLKPWTLSIQRPASVSVKNKLKLPGTSSRTASVQGPVLVSQDSTEEIRPIEYCGMQFSSQGTVSATFAVQGHINISGDGVGHNVTITEVGLAAEMSWVCVPKKDSRVHLKAKIKNASEYTLLAGNASVYVDGSFISKSDIPLISPEEIFDCPLGLDLSIRVIYHPRTKKVRSQSVFYNKSSNYTFTQPITVYNTKPTTSGASSKDVKIKIIDQVPVSEDSSISVKLMQPALNLPNEEGLGSIGAGSVSASKVPSPVKVDTGVQAIWDGADEVGNGDADVASLGREGRLCWICEVPSQNNVQFQLQYEVVAPLRANISGL